VPPSSNRPLSPHLQIYRLPLTGLVSITHRVTGVLLVFGLALLIWQLIAVSAGEQPYLAMQAWLALWPLQLIYWGFVYALMFHLCHGVRHLVWDAGFGFERDHLNRLALAEPVCALLLTIIAFFAL